jgi:hypothetical protein
VAVALPAGVGPGAGLGARAIAGGAADKRGHVDFHRAALKTFLEADFEVVAQIAAAQLGRATAAAALPAHEIAEDIVEDIGHR